MAGLSGPVFKGGLKIKIDVVDTHGSHHKTLGFRLLCSHISQAGSALSSVDLDASART